MAVLFRQIDALIMRAMGFVVIVTNLAVTALILFLVLARFVLGWSVVGVLELATLSAMWLYMCGAVIAARNREHLVVDFLSQSLVTPRAKALPSRGSGSLRGLTWRSVPNRNCCAAKALAGSSSPC